jgi:hypothetical protein
VAEAADPIGRRKDQEVLYDFCMELEYNQARQGASGGSIVYFNSNR